MRLDLYKETASPIQKKDIAKIVCKVFKILNRSSDFFLSVALVKKNAIHSLNKTWRRIDRPTNVLSFSGQPSSRSREKLNFILPPKENNFLGEIVIADPVLRKEAAELGCSYRSRFNFLLVHGLLHLAGYHHANGRSRKIMEGLENKFSKII